MNTLFRNLKSVANFQDAMLDDNNKKDRSRETTRTEVSLEVESYLHLFIVTALMSMKSKRTKEALACSKMIIERAAMENRRTLDRYLKQKVS